MDKEGKFVMSNTFSFKRFGQVLAKDGRAYFRNYGIGMIASVCLPVVFWVTSLVLGIDFDSETRGNIIGGFLFAIVTFIPEVLYGKANLSRDGVSFAMLPATAAEKFFSMFFYCSILTPIVCGLGCWGVDSLMTLMPFGGFKEFVHPINMNNPIGIIIREIAVFLLFFLLLGSCFLLGNMFFKKHKAAKTFGWLLLVFFVLVVAILVPAMNNPKDLFIFNMYAESFLWIFVSIFIVGIILINYLTYRRIKNQKY